MFLSLSGASSPPPFPFFCRDVLIGVGGWGGTGYVAGNGQKCGILRLPGEMERVCPLSAAGGKLAAGTGNETKLSR